MKAIVSQIIIGSVSTSSDKSLRFRAVTPELSDAEAVAFMGLRGINLRCLFEPVDYPTDGKAEIKNPLSQKSPSTRLRAVLFVLYSQLVKAEKLTNQTFEEFYVRQMESTIETFKQQLDPEI